MIDKFGQGFNPDAPVPGETAAPTSVSPGASKTPAQKQTSTDTSSQAPHPSSSEVVQMQEQLINIYKQFKQSHLFQDKPELNLNQEKANDPTGTAFRSLLLDKFVLPSNIKGTYGQLPYPGDQPGQKTKPNLRPVEQGDEIIHLINTIQYVGKPTKSGFNQPDGIWGEKTNNALKNTYALLHGLQDFSSKVGVQAQFPKGIEELPKWIPATPQDLKNPSENAQQITKILNASLSSLGHLLQIIDSDKRFTGDAPIMQAQQTQNKSTGADHQLVWNQTNEPWFPMTIQVETPKGFKNIELRLTDLWDKHEFEKFLNRNQIWVSGQNPMELKTLIPKFLAQIEEKIKNLRSTLPEQVAETR